MNVLPAHAPAPSAPGRPATGGEPPTGFGSLLAGHVGPPPEVPPEAAAGDGEPGDVAAAVQAAIAAWRADPAEVGLGTRLRQVLAGTVRATTARAGGVAGAAAATAVAEDAGTVDGAEVSPATVGAVTGAAAAERTGPVAPVEVAEPVVAQEGSDTARAGVTPTAGTAPAVARPDEVPVEEGMDGEGRVRPLPTPTTTDAEATSGQRPDAVVAPSRPSSVSPGTAPDAPVAGPAAARPASPVAVTRPRTAVEVPARPEPAVGPDRPVDAPELVAATTSSVDASPAAARPDGPATTTSAAALDRVLRAVEALEHAPPPRRLAVEVEGVRLTVAMRGDEVSVSVRTGADQLAPGWQRDLATVLRDRGLGLATDSGSAQHQGQGHDPRRGPQAGADTAPAHTRAPSRPLHPADPAGLRL